MPFIYMYSAIMGCTCTLQCTCTCNCRDVGSDKQAKDGVCMTDHHDVWISRIYSSLSLSLSLYIYIYIYIYIAITTLRPDAVIYSQSIKSVIMLELTVPIEDHVSISENIKTTRYRNLVSECHSNINGWKAHLITIEIGCRGYTPTNLSHKLKQLGLPKASCSSIRRACSITALCCSYVLYLNRNNTTWHKPPYISGH